MFGANTDRVSRELAKRIMESFRNESFDVSMSLKQKEAGLRALCPKCGGRR